jgi:hypothetical protein
VEREAIAGWIAEKREITEKRKKKQGRGSLSYIASSSNTVLKTNRRRDAGSQKKLQTREK